jgi:hypothetical protein
MVNKILNKYWLNQLNIRNKNDNYIDIFDLIFIYIYKFLLTKKSLQLQDLVKL